MKRLGIILGAFAGVLVLGFFLASALIKPDQIKEKALERIRSSSGYSVDAGDASLKISFTGAGIRVEDISFASPDATRSGRVEDVDVLVKILPLLRKRVELNRLVLHGPVYEQKQSAGAAKSKEDGNPALAFFAVESWEIQDGVYKQAGDWGKLEASDLDLEGGLRLDPEKGGEGTARGTAGKTFLDTPKGAWNLPEVRVDAGFTVSPKVDRVDVTRMTLASGDLKAAFSGAYEDAGTAWEGRLAGRVEPVSWNAVAPFLPAAAAAPLEPWTLSGTIEVPEIEVVTAGDATRTSGQVEVSGFSARHREAPLGITETRARLRFSPERMELEEAVGKVGEDAFTVSGSWEPATGAAAMNLDTRLAASNLGGLLPETAPLSLHRGSVVVDLAVRGTTPFEAVPEITGRVSGENLEGSFRDLPLEKAGGTIRFTGRAAEIQDLALVLGNSDMNLSGTVPDLRDPRMNFILRSTALDLNQLFPEETPEKKSASGEEPMVVALPGTGSIEVGTLKFRKFRVENIRSRASLDLDGISLEQLTGRLYGGNVEGNLHVRPAETPGLWRYEGAFDLSHVQAASMILGWNPAAALVEGDLGGHLDLAGRAGGDLDPRKAFRLEGKLNITEGALVNFAGLSALGSALRIKGIDPRRWPFKDLGLRFRVEEGNLVLETMRMDQAGIGWDMEGRIGLDGGLQLSGTADLDPDRVTLPEEIAFLGPFMVEEDGRIPVDFRVGGTLDNPDPQLDWKAVAARATQRAKKQEGKKLQQKLEEKLPDSDALNKLKKNILGGGNE